MNSVKSLYKKIDAQFIEEVCSKLRRNEKVHRRLEGKGLLHIDRQLPFLTIYRLSKEAGCLETAKLIKGEASYFIIPSTMPKARVAVLIKSIIKVLEEVFGAFLLFEIWTEHEFEHIDTPKEPLTPIFDIYADTSGELVSTCESLRQALVTIKIQRAKAVTNISYHRKTRPAGKTPLLSKKVLVNLNCHSIGVGLKPIYIDSKTNELFPLIFKKYHAEFSHALKHCFYEFSQSISRHNPTHYHSLGAKAITKLIYKIDHQLSAISSQIDFLLWVTPINTDSSWRGFKRGKFQKIPKLEYRPVPIDPAHVKEQLFGIPIRKIHDPTIQALFEEKRIELDRQLMMLYERNTENFVLSSMQLYGRVEDSLFDFAKQILTTFAGPSRDDTFTGKHDAKDFAALAKEEIAKICEFGKVKVKPEVIITDKISGLMVNKGNLLIGKSVRVPNNRAKALLQHEVGTHIVSYLNGCTQPLKLLSFGLPGYDELQEGLAVLAEYLVGQLSKQRIKLLAGRVVAARYLEERAGLREIFKVLNEDYQFEEKTAYRIAIRIIRGGGLTKDAIYLRGLINVIKHFQADGEFDILFTGKFSQSQIPIVQELLYRGVLKRPSILPTYINNVFSLKRLENLRNNKSLIDILKG